MTKIKNEKYDVVFLISGQSLSFSESMIEQIKKSQPYAKFVLYQWDSQTNFPYIKKYRNILISVIHLTGEMLKKIHLLCFTAFIQKYMKI